MVSVAVGRARKGSVHTLGGAVARRESRAARSPGGALADARSSAEGVSSLLLAGPITIAWACKKGGEASRRVEEAIFLFLQPETSEIS